MSERPEHIVLVGTAPTELEASILVAALKEKGISSTTSGEYTAGFRAEAPGCVQVLVAEEDAARARDALEEAREDQDHIDWSQIDVGDPED